MLNKIYKKIIYICVASVLASPIMAFAQNDTPSVIIHAKIDSAQITMADRTAIHVEVVKDSHKGAMAGLPTAQPGQVVTYGGVEVRDIQMDSTDIGNGRMQLNYTLIVQPFEPGVVTFPAFKYVVDRDTFYSETTSLKVIEPQMPKEMVDSLYINPMEGTVSIKGRWYDFVPSWWYWLVIGLATVALIVVIVMLYKKNGPGLLPHKKVVPPHILALDRLKKLKNSHLIEDGRDKEYYTQLTDILREYLDGRFGINAREMSTTQILEAVSDNSEISKFAAELSPMLETADFVKFAKLRALPDENIRSYKTVLDFVEQTKPVEVDPEEEKTQKKKTVGKGKKSKSQSKDK